MDNNKLLEDYSKKIPLLNNLISNTILQNRIKIFYELEHKYFSNPKFKVLDVGTTPSLSAHENIFLKNYKWKNNITCLSNQNLEILSKEFKDTKFIIGDGKKMDFEENEFEIVFSSATIEHVGSFQEQLKFISECKRVASKFVIITTPNRYYPIDFHTKLPFLHMFPKKIHRAALKFFGDNFFSQEKNLNLLSKREIIKLCEKLNLKFQILNHRFLGLTSNYIIVIS